MEALKGEATWAGEPPALGALGAIHPGRDGGFNVDTSGPVLLLEDGTPLPLPNSSLRRVKAGHGAYAHPRFGVLFTTPDGSSPLTTGRTYTAALNPQRACRAGRWLDPGDVALSTPPGAPFVRVTTLTLVEPAAPVCAAVSPAR